MLKTRIKELRAARDMDQARLAELVGVRRETIGRLENGQYNPSLKLAMDIAKVFGLTVEEIFTFTEEYPKGKRKDRFPTENGLLCILITLKKRITPRCRAAEQCDGHA